MGKPSKKAAAAVAATPAVQVLKGKAGNKREAEDRIDRAVSAKKKKVVPPAKPVPPAKEAEKKAKKLPPPKTEETSSSEDQEMSNSESEEEEAAQPVEEDSSDDSSAMSSESDEETANKPAAKLPAQVISENGNKEGSSSEDESDDDDDTAPSTIPETAEKNSSNDEEDDEDDSNEESDEEDDSNEESDEEDENNEESDEESTPKKPEMPVSTQSQATTSKTLFMGNAPFRADIDQIKEFFKEAGTVVDVRFPLNEDGRRKCFCYVDFASVEDAQKAFELNGREFMSRQVRLDFATPHVSKESDKKDGSNEESEEEDDSDEDPKPKKESPGRTSEKQSGTKEPKTPVSTKSQESVSKTLFMGNAPFKADVDQVQHFFKDAGLVIDVRFPLNEDGRRKGFCYVEFASVEAAQKAMEFNGREFMSRQVRLDFAAPHVSKKSDKKDGSNESEEEDDSDEDPKPKKESPGPTSEKQSGTKEPKTPVITKSEESVSKTLFMGNAPFKADVDQVQHFFKDAGLVIDVRFPLNEDGRRKGFCYVEFASVEAAQKAMEFNGREFMSRQVRLDFANEKGSYTPQVGNDTASSLSIFVKGFDKSLGEDKIRSSLEQHFAECGEITRVSIPSDNNTGVIKGIAYMDFKDQESVSKALKLNGSDLGGCELVVDNATPKVDRPGGRFGGGSGGRRGGGRSGGGGRFGGRNSGRGGRGFGRR